MELVILVGLPGAGKSTFFEERFAATHTVVSRDRMPAHRRPAARQAELVGAALGRGESVVVDNTNPAVADRAPFIAEARRRGARVVGYFFPPDLPACRRRNAARTGPARVPDVALYVALKRLAPPAWGEGFD